MKLGWFYSIGKNSILSFYKNAISTRFVNHFTCKLFQRCLWAIYSSVI